MAIVITLFGIAIGAIGGLLIGDITYIWFDGTVFDLRIILALVGILIGYYAARFLAKTIILK